MSQNQAVEVQINDGIRTGVLNPEVRAKASRRRFTTEYKLKILFEAESRTESGELGALLRREGLYDSHLSRWRRAQRAGRLGKPSKGQKTTAKNKALKQEVAELQAENTRFQKALEQAELVIDVQKKLSQLLGLETMKRNGP